MSESKIHRLHAVSSGSESESDRQPGSHILVGWIESAKGSLPVVDFEGNTAGPIVARSTMRLLPEELLAAVASRQGAILLFEAGDFSRPILTGLVQPSSETPLLDEIMGTSVARVAEEACVDGKRVRIEARDEIVLQCGEASITLRRNGKVVIRGTYLETRSTGLNRIKGGKIELN